MKTTKLVPVDMVVLDVDLLQGGLGQVLGTFRKWIGHLVWSGSGWIMRSGLALFEKYLKTLGQY